MLKVCGPAAGCVFYARVHGLGETPRDGASLPSVEAALVHVVAHERFEHAVDHVLRLVDVGRAAREAAQAPVRRGHEGRALLDVLREPPPDVARALALGDLARARLDVVVKLALVRVAEALLLSRKSQSSSQQGVSYPARRVPVRGPVPRPRSAPMCVKVRSAKSRFATGEQVAFVQHHHERQPLHRGRRREDRVQQLHRVEEAVRPVKKPRSTQQE